MLILRPRASRIAPSEADAMPLPSEETTPPVTNTNRLMGYTAVSMHARSPTISDLSASSQGKLLEIDGSSDYQIGPGATIDAHALCDAHGPRPRTPRARARPAPAHAPRPAGACAARAALTASA